MMRRVICLAMLFVATTSAFVLQPQSKCWGAISGRTPTSTSSTLFMFNIDGKKEETSSSASVTTSSPPAAPALMTAGEATSSEVEDIEKPLVRNVVKDMNTGELKEVKWVDPAMRANTRPWEMSWWAYIAFGFPFIVLANDAFHFLPKDGPLGFLGRI